MHAAQICFHHAVFIKLKIKAITNEWCAFGVDDSAWEKVEVILFAIHYHCVPCIVPPL